MYSIVRTDYTRKLTDQKSDNSIALVYAIMKGQYIPSTQELNSDRNLLQMLITIYLYIYSGPSQPSGTERDRELYLSSMVNPQRESRSICPYIGPYYECSQQKRQKNIYKYRQIIRARTKPIRSRPARERARSRKITLSILHAITSSHVGFTNFNLNTRRAYPYRVTLCESSIDK